MPSSGGGTGTPIVVSSPSTDIYDQMEELIGIPNCAVSLPRYAKLIGYAEPAFWGIVIENAHLYGCDPLWTEAERMNVALALAEAQQEIEQVVGYPLCPTWIAGTVADEWQHNDRWVDAQKLGYCLLTRYPRLIAAGIRAVTMIDEDSPVVHGAEVGVVGPLATAATDTDEIHVYYPDSDREIIPSSIVISSGFVTIEIPRVRMVIPQMLSGVEGGIMYEELEYFLEEVDVKRIYNDPSTNATLVRAHCSNNHCAGGCGECTQSACMYIRDPYIGEVNIVPATWNADTAEWDSRVVCAGNYSRVRLNYLAGMRYLNLQAEVAILRLAHSKMGRPPCSCDKTGEIWKNDYGVPNVLTRERINCPFGLSQGAWTAWKFANSLASRRAAIL